VKRLFISLPENLPQNFELIAWRLPGQQPESGQASDVSALPAADEIWLVLPAARVLLSSIKLSRRALKQLNGALGNALEDQLMLDPATTHIALGKVEGDDLHPLAVIESGWLEQALALCQQHGIVAAGAIPETLLWLGDGAEKPWSARWNGHGGFVRTDTCAGFALDDGDAETPPLALQLAVAEARQKNVLPSVIHIETTMAVNLAAWSRQLDCLVQAQTLRADPRPPAINLLQGAFANRRSGSFTNSRLAHIVQLFGAEHASKYRIAAGLALAALLVHVLGVSADWARLSWENKNMRAEMRQVFQETFPETQAIVDPVLQMQRQLSELRRARGFAENGDLLHALAAIGGQVGGINGFSYENGRLTLEQPSTADIEALRSALAAQGYHMAASGEPGNLTLTLERSRQ
jgi:general secretion pathway protein L